ncbi:MAG: hypothetical protein HYU48_02250 [Candidatus Levybacteria bacterium]|nr:hypothetical protein [Candidatus Levybacteria bacterium]
MREAEKLGAFISEKISRKEFEKVLKGVRGPVEQKDGWYFMSGREKLIGKRLKRRKESARKLEIAYKVADVLSSVPTALLIGVSGGVSLHNAEKNDDIDIFVIAKKNTIWLTRISIVLLLLFRGKYRKRLDRKVADKICLNMLIDEKGLTFPNERQDLYTAHEIVQMKPIFNRNKTYEKFLGQNTWVLGFMPNALEKIKDKRLKIKDRKKLSAIAYLLPAVEFLVKEIQLWYIKRHMSRETISGEMLAFHPLNNKEKIMQAYDARLKKYGQKI